jgi:hypothetical protein
MIRNQEEALFDEWSRAMRIANFAKDGIVCERKYKASKPRLLFVLKETNDSKKNFDLRKFIASGARAYTWDNVARWANGIRNVDKRLRWEEVKTITPEQRAKHLASVAAINMKKSPGGHTTDAKLFRKAFEQDKEFIRRQIALYKADLVVLCGSIVVEGFRLVCGSDFAGPWRTTSRGIEFVEYQPGKFAVSYAHPEARVQDCLLFYGLVDAVREIELIRSRL